MQILNYIPCKTNSTRIKGKNIKFYKNKLLVDYTIGFAKRTKNKILLSSENEELLKSKSVDYKHLRRGIVKNKNLSNLKVMQHLAKNGFFKNFDYICLLQPTHPLRRLIDYKNIINSVVNINNTPLVSVINFDKQHTQKKKIIIEGSYYVFSKDFILNANLNKKIKYYYFQIPSILNVNIDTNQDETYFLNLLKDSENLKNKGYII